MAGEHRWLRSGKTLGKVVILASVALAGEVLAKPEMNEKQKCKAAIASYFELDGREINSRISIVEQRKSGGYILAFKKSQQRTFKYLCRTDGNRIVWGDAQEMFGTMEMTYRMTANSNVEVSYVDDTTLKKNTLKYRLSDL
ncbi:hypothetical protein SOASR030_02900 [Leminorella grimontii]|uniref:Uncharacterized protein n=1 Tax=Leminorella grimontii TaxID=82981 RepID=A0AAV5MWG1_9GAMM|nr:hypothetical protein [Leminorella grimontii]KFC95642.1 hypothetical protein GLGR_1804 [Leminorella grimontii ATCC 33999 = DSM 5078]GKX54178.1 hypothetical protein SOASR030_02900 [Leminorella grimontii]GKX60581.1 hypothetical protein SOASR031_28960 [Leminorella grimontii]VFS59845.1 Uncharacterised protein [Leminorella grimontii]